MIYNILLLALLVEFMVGIKNPKNSLGIAVVIILLIPSAIKFSIGVNLNSFNLSMLVFIFLLIPVCFKYSPLYPRIRKPFVWYTIYVFVSSLIVSVGFIPMSEYIQNMVLFLFEYSIVAYVMCWIKFDDSEIRKFNNVLLLVSIIIILYSLICYVTKINVYMAYINIVSDVSTDMSEKFMQEQRGILDGRVSGNFGHQLQLGQCVLLLFSYFFFEHSGKKIFSSIFLLGLFVTAILTGSRSSLVPIFLVILINLFSYKKKEILLRCVVALVSISITFPLLPNKTQDFVKGSVLFWDDKAASKADINGSSFGDRKGQLSAAFSHIDDSFLLGKGFNFHVKHGEEYSDDVYGYESIFLSHTIDGGILGTLAFLLFYYQLYRQLLKRCCKNIGRLRVHSLCLPFFVSMSLTGISYSMFCFFLILYMMTLYRVQMK